MASSMISSAAVASINNRATPAQASMIAPFTGLKSTLAFPLPERSTILPLSLAMEEKFLAGRTDLCSVSTVTPGYYDGRYWTMWKLPMFGCTDASQVLAELEEAKKAYPNAFVRIIGFDNKRQVQCISFIAYKPENY
ncbi:hypothetical protein IFM89_013434 [Coptis chinensis]|uniref:Ribulose bisphosphate carboxylase small subunit domain-containing protein n=1 Tax=Coptis chinensis TaxID=261450 RepID=A0A835GZ62_9MAGN|nr:hypothetical protein IFM89_013434 [Coptis chinensis]